MICAALFLSVTLALVLSELWQRYRFDIQRRYYRIRHHRWGRHQPSWRRRPS